MPDNNIHYSLSRTDTPKDTRGTPASDLRIDPTAAKPSADPCPNLQNAQVPSSVLREMLRDAEIMYRYKHARRKKKLFLTLFWIFFAIYAVGVTLITLTGYESLSLVESLILFGSCALMCVPIAAVNAFVLRWIIIAGYTRAFAGDAEELQYIEHLKDCMCQSNQKGQA